MAYASVAELREYLDQVPSGAPVDARLQSVLNRASAIIDREIGFSFGTAAATTRTVYGDGTDYLRPPAFVSGSVTAVTTLSGYTVPGYVEREGFLVVTYADTLGPYRGVTALVGRGAPVGGWLFGVPYAVAATFGYSSTPPDIVEACLEIAVDLWRFKDAGSIKSVGVEGAGVVKGGGLPETARLILDSYKTDDHAGIW